MKRTRHSMKMISLSAAALALTTVLAVTAGPPALAAGILPETVTECLDCHDDDSLDKELLSGEILSLTVTGEEFSGSVHLSMGCTGCHLDVSIDDHPEEREIASSGEYVKAASKMCRRCHLASRLGEEPMHRYLSASAGAPPCASCHDAHSITDVASWKASLDDRTYCLTCHREQMRLTLGNGEELSLTMEESILDGSVHTDHDCTDCHSDFGKETHFVRDFKSRREHSLALSQVCRECHDDMFDAFEGSIHFSLLEGGNLAAPMCTDCHGYHGIGPKDTLETIAGLPCRQCHDAVFDAYAGSMHGIAKGKAGHLDAPACSDCHQAHGVDAASWTERLRGACLGCHDGPVGDHEKWLPNAELHLEAVACPACHVPRAARGIDLQLYDGRTGDPLTDEQLSLLIGDTGAGLSGEGSLGSRDLWDLLRAVNGNAEDPRVTVTGHLKVRTGIEAHRMGGKAEALSDCVTCHMNGAEPFRNVTVSLAGRDGRLLHYEAESEVLTSAASISSVGDFYALGGTRIRLLDFLLLAAVLGGMSVPALHMTARVLARKR
jgi:predicted CXXCH cytochrome family protein